MTKEEFKKRFIKDQVARKKKASLDAKCFREDVFTKMDNRRNLNKGRRVGQF